MSSCYESGPAPVAGVATVQKPHSRELTVVEKEHKISSYRTVWSV